MKDLTKVTLEEASKPLIKYLAENHNPHTTSIVTSMGIEILEGVQVFSTDEFIVDKENEQDKLSSKEVLDNSPEPDSSKMETTEFKPKPYFHPSHENSGQVAEPNLIAKAGEKVVVVDKGEFTGNMKIFEGEILLTKDLYEGQELSNGVICNTHLFKMKFEKAPNPTTEQNTEHVPFCSRTDELYMHIFEKHGIRFSTEHLNEIIDIVHKTAGSPREEISGKINIEISQDVFDLIAKEDDYVSSVDEENAEQEEKVNNMRIAIGIIGFKFTDLDLDMLVSLYDLVLEHGGNLDLKTITEKQFEINEKHRIS